MSEQDAEIELLKSSVSCAALLERLPPVWRLDRAESSRHSLKYRRCEGEIIIVNHDGRGWWDPLSEAKGDIFTLVRHLEPGVGFTDARRPHRHRLSRSPNDGSGARPCRPVRRLGSISPNGADCRRPYSSPHVRPMRSGKVRAAAPGSRTGTARDN